MHVSFSNGTLGQFWGRYWVHLSSKNNPVELPPSEIVPHTANPGVDPGDCNDDQFACHDGTCVPKVSVLLLPATSVNTIKSINRFNRLCPIRLIKSINAPKID